MIIALAACWLAGVTPAAVRSSLNAKTGQCIACLSDAREGPYGTGPMSPGPTCPAIVVLGVDVYTWRMGIHRIYRSWTRGARAR